jgi:hypothetical protein
MPRVGAALFVFLAAACTGGGHHAAKPTTPAPSKTSVTAPHAVAAVFRPYDLSFHHPSAWREQDFDVPAATMSSVVTYLSTMKLHDPCTITTDATGTTSECGYPIARLADGAVLVIWETVATLKAGGGPDVPHPNTTISGEPARVDRTQPGTCSDIGATETIVATITRPTGNVFEMTACLRGPNLASAEAQVNAMLRSVQID